MYQSESPFLDFEKNQPHVEYAGFWLRFVAYIIDGIVLIIPSMIINTAFHVNSMFDFSTGHFRMNPNFDKGNYLIANLFIIAITWMYYAVMESSAKQATLGKLALKLKVTDMDGGRISFGNATGRYFAKIISGLILCIGYMMAGWTDKKQALHDSMANTLVIKANPNQIFYDNTTTEGY